MEQFSEEIRRYNYIESEIDAAYHRLNVKLDISDTESYILYSLHEDPDSSQNDIVKKTGLSKQTINSAVKKMIQNGIFHPLRGLRNEQLVLTEKGEQIMDEKISVIVHIENQIFESWSSEEQQHFIEMNEEYLQKLREETEKLEPVSPKSKQS